MSHYRVLPKVEVDIQVLITYSLRVAKWQYYTLQYCDNREFGKLNAVNIS